MKPELNVVYRGPLERSRLGFLVDSAADAFGTVYLTWLLPQAASRQKLVELEEWARVRPHVVDYRVLDGSYAGWPVTRRRLRPVLESRAPLLAVGFSSLDFVRRSRANRLVWCVNGIPEEAAVSAGRGSGRRSDVAWRSKRIGRRPDLVITVSQRMAALVETRAGIGSTFVAPTCVDRSIFRPGAAPARSVVYSGSGAAWQWVDLTAAVWARLAEEDPQVTFTVVSRDPRCAVLAEAVPAERVQLVSAPTVVEVAPLLRTSGAAFLLRQDSLVNRVSYPTKLGEYVASGVPVVTTSLDWDPGDLVAETGAGVTVAPTASPEAIAAATLEVLDRDPGTVEAACKDAAQRLDLEVWRGRLADRLASL